jgi:fumarylacetoacetate (FAA) hydrolase
VRFLNYATFDLSDRPRAGLWHEGRVYSLAELLGDKPMEPIGRGNLEELPSWCERLSGDLQTQASRVASFSPDEILYLPPVLPAASFRDFYAFEEHVRRARSRRGLEVPEQWYRFPVFYFSNHSAFLGHDAKFAVPPDGEWLDFELEVAAVLWRGGRDLSESEAETCIAGYSVLNDWSARKVQREEMAVGLGPAKGKDFASSLGPWLVTPDALADHRSGKGYDLQMSARVNGRELTRNNWNTIHYSFAEMIARASRGVELSPGDVFGSGTVGGGCILEIGPEEAGGWLQSGDIVELEIDELGSLSNAILP